MLNLIRIATRKSPLALWQAEYIGKQIQHHWPNLDIELVPMTTSGDRFLQDKLLAVGGKGLFVKELEEALLGTRADIAVHSMKDVPPTFPEGLRLAAIAKRHNPLDALIAKEVPSLLQLPKGAKIGTTSLRRQCQLLALRPDFIVQPLRGNIHTRLKKLEEGAFDAIILAAAGLERMGLHEKISELLTEDQMLPACGQGALGIECRSDDERILQIIAALNDQSSALCVHVERQVAAQLGGNCHTPIGIYCKLKEAQQLDLRAKVMSLDGQQVIQSQHLGFIDEAGSLVKQCIQALFDQGAERLLTPHE